MAIVDEDGSALSRRIADAPMPPWFQHTQAIRADAVDAAMDAGRFTFVLDVPPRFESDLLAGREPTIQLAVDATAVTQAAVVMTLLSGSSTPLDAMPRWLQLAMQLSPSTHFVAVAQGVLYRGADLAILWPKLLAMGGIGAALFAAALMRFRQALAEVG